MIVSAVSLAIATVVSGIHYRRHEFDEFVYNTPQWILTWQGISLLVLVIAAVGYGITKVSTKRR
ncbi:hypothetical protein [Corynebacterium gerontici]|uniref:Uncharacterized protein n=1 Tax=Corynebacterium gerontici TaxID=2079234 RepID=A0A3G6J6Y9_9CORY|nr:hypothetical protein [Corynebacterium gerontici]AZA12210.1 hypothetical protein CGERO_09615 [Corynebacterium gerontici]